MTSKSYILGMAVAASLVLLPHLFAASLIKQDNASSYYSTCYPLHSGDIIQGFVRLNNGFALAPYATGVMDTVFSVSGGFSLHETSTLRLNKNLEFDDGVTLTTDGYIDGRGHAFTLNNTFALADDTILHINGDTIIDGRNSTLYIGNNAQIFVDTNVTLTLRNVTIQNGQRTNTFPPIRLAAPGSKLALDNVIIEPTNADFTFQRGQLFIHNDVLVTGTLGFVYQSTKPAIITQNGHFTFDPGTTFSFYTSTTGDALLSAKDFLKFQDASSVLMLNGCSLSLGYTDMRLTKGSVLFDNAVTVNAGFSDVLDVVLTPTVGVLDTAAKAVFVTFVPAVPPAEEVRTVAWHPNGKFIIGGTQTGKVATYTFNNTASALTQAGSGFTTFGPEIKSIAWSPDGRYVLAGNTSGNVKMYDFTGSGTTGGIANNFTGLTTFGTSVNVVSWSPDGRYVVAGNTDIGPTGNIKSYRFNGSAGSGGLAAVGTGQTTFGTEVSALAWRPDGNYVVAGNSSNNISVYQFTGDGSSGGFTAVGSGTTSFGTGKIRSLAWSPDGRYIVAGDGAGLVKVFIFTSGGTTGGLTQIGSGSEGFGSGNIFVSWHPQGEYIVVGGNGAGLKIYSTSGQTNGLLRIAQEVFAFTNVLSVAWSPDGRFVLAGSSDVPYNIKVFPVSFVYRQQADHFLGGLVLGNSALGSSSDVFARLLGGAQINLHGPITYDCAS